MYSHEIKNGRLYDELSYLMASISPPEEYAEEAAHWQCVLKEKLGEGKHTLLELGVGGGHNLSHLTTDFSATAVDLAPAMLDACKKLNPDVELFCGDMRSVRLGRKFDAVLIHDAIDYLVTEADLLATFQTAAAHLQPGGVFVTTVDQYAERFSGPLVESSVHTLGEDKVSYTAYVYDPDPNDTAIETIMTYYIESAGALRIELDRHVTGLFPRATWFRLLDMAGFATEIRTFSLSSLDKPYELLVCVFR